MRGAHQRLRFILGEIGIIPACAGSTFVIVYPPRFSRDHPRMCGEHLWMHASTGATSGSSPHVRGALWPRVSGRASIGIIPACAGSTGHNAGYALRSRDHPRMCGEHKSMAFCVGTLRGSSPHVRGALVWSCPYCGHSGIIPACAGSTGNAVEWRASSWDHPRMCGEHWFGGHWFRCHGLSLGIIPACAGSTSFHGRL